MIEKSYQLVVQKGPKSGQVFPLTAPAVTLGRDADTADIVLDDPEVSRLHARLVKTEEGYRLEDLGSTNGTFVDGRNIGAGPILLEPDQEVQMGSGVILLYQLAALTSEPLPTILEEPEAPEAPPMHKELLDTAVPPLPVLPATEPLAASEPPAEPEAEPGAEPAIDPMLPPVFDDLSDMEAVPSLRQLEEAAPEEEPAPPDLPELPNLPELTTEPPVRKSSPRVVSAGEAAPPPPPGRNSNKRLAGILVAVLLILLCCCCGFLVFMYQWGGDWLLRQMQLIP